MPTSPINIVMRRAGTLLNYVSSQNCLYGMECALTSAITGSISTDQFLG